MNETVVQNIAVTCEGLGDAELSGITLDSGDRRLLDVSFGDFDAHVAMQPGAVSYYCYLLKEAKRRLSAMQRAYDRWEKKAYAGARVVVMNAASAPSAVKAEDIKARVIIDNETEIENWDARIDKLQADCDTLDAWYEGWRQKSFSIREHAGIEQEERFNSSPSITEPRSPSAFARSPEKAQGRAGVLALIRKHKETEANQGKNGE